MKNYNNKKTTFKIFFVLFLATIFLSTSCKKEEVVKTDKELIQGSWSLVSTRYVSYLDDVILNNNVYEPVVQESIVFLDGSYVKRVNKKVFESGNYLLVDKVISFKSLTDSIIIKEFSTLNNTSLVTFKEENYTLPNGRKERYLIEYNYKKN